MNRFDNIPPEFEAIKDRDEQIYWVGQPTLIPFVASGIPFLIIGIIWFIISASIFGGAFIGMGSMMGRGFSAGFLLFGFLHQFPFFLSIFNFIRLFLVHKNTYYGYSNKRILHRTGFFGIDFKTIDYDKIQNIEVNVNFFERLFNVGSIRFFSGEIVHSDQGSRPSYTVFKAIENPYEVFKKIKETSVDIKTDWNYPNQLRPDENPGYQTKYRGD